MFYHILKYVTLLYHIFYTILPYFSICLAYVYYIVAICSPYFNTFYNVLPYIYNLLFTTFYTILVYFYHMLTIFLPYFYHHIKAQQLVSHQSFDPPSPL